MIKNYFIDSRYVSRLDNDFYNDTNSKDEWQDEVYLYAKKIVDQHRYKNVCDIGTGSGYKLMKYFNNFNTLGIDMPPTVEFLKKQYPDKNWSSNFSPVSGYELIISSDVIEHIPDPDILLDLIIKSNPKMILLSTPDRDILYKEENYGPPKNSSHVREWNKPEFYNYINSKLSVIDHFISNKSQGTQVILATLKK